MFDSNVVNEVPKRINAIVIFICSEFLLKEHLHYNHQINLFLYIQIQNMFRMHLVIRK